MAGLARKIARRTFLFGAAALGGGFAVGYYYYQKPLPNPLLDEKAAGDSVFNAYVKLGGDGRITVIAPRAEMGQGVMTTLAALVAEELEVGLDQVDVEHGPPSVAYYNRAALVEGAPFPDFDRGWMAEGFRSVSGIAAKFLGLQLTGGSSSTVDAFEKMRRAGATAREMLKGAAAKRLGVAVGTLTAENGKVLHAASGKSLSYAELAADAALIEPPAEVMLKRRKDWKLLGKPQKRVDMLAKVTGAPIFGIDVALPDMVYATVRISPRLGGRMNHYDVSAARKVAGVIDVVEIDCQSGHGFGVIAANTWAAFKGADAVVVEWGEAPYPVDSAAIDKVLVGAVASARGSVMRDVGDADAAFADPAGRTVIEAEYRAPYLAHATMEPMNATARLKDGVLEIWSPNQAPTLIPMICGPVAGVKPENVHVHTPQLGGGFGRRVEIDFSLYATLLAMKTGGKPVKVTWTREEDMTHDVYRPVALARFRAVLDGSGLPVALDARIASPSPIRSLLKRTFPSMSPLGPDKSITDGAFNQPYAIANLKVTGIEADLAVPTGFWRSVGNSFNAFFHESFLDEVAAAGKLDPVELRLKLMGPFATATGVVRRVAEMSNWATPPGPDRARGIAMTLAFGAHVAQVVEIEKTDAGIHVRKLWCAADVGLALDPAIVRAQIMSGAIFGLSAAFGEEVTFKDGMVQQKNFTSFDALRIWQCPQIEIDVLETADEMSGTGEIGTPAALPALANAIFRLTGQRIRTLPLSREVTFA